MADLQSVNQSFRLSIAPISARILFSDSILLPPLFRPNQRATTDGKLSQRGNITWSYRQSQSHRSFKVGAGSHTQALFKGHRIPNKIHPT